jgi:hypothetical protein
MQFRKRVLGIKIDVVVAVVEPERAQGIWQRRPRGGFPLSGVRMSVDSSLWTRRRMVPSPCPCCTPGVVLHARMRATTRRDAAAARRASTGDHPYTPRRDADKDVKHGSHTRLLASSATLVVLAHRLELARRRTWAQARRAPRSASGRRRRARLAGRRVALHYKKPCDL